MKGSLIILITFIITITCDHAKADHRIEGSSSLLMGKLIGQGAIRSEVVGAARQKGVGPSEIEEVKGTEVAESARQHVDPRNELQIGRKIKEYQKNPQDAQVRMDIGGTDLLSFDKRSIPRARGKVLDGDVQTGIYVPNPIKVLGEIKARGGDIETVEGEVVAGDAGDIDVISMKESDIQSRSACGRTCESGTICCTDTNTCQSSCSEGRSGSRTICGVTCPSGYQCCTDSRTCQSSCPNGRSGCSDGQIYCSHLSKCTLPQECRI